MISINEWENLMNSKNKKEFIDVCFEDGFIKKESIMIIVELH